MYILYSILSLNFIFFCDAQSNDVQLKNGVHDSENIETEQQDLRADEDVQPKNDEVEDQIKILDLDKEGVSQEEIVEEKQTKDTKAENEEVASEDLTKDVDSRTDGVEEALEEPKEPTEETVEEKKVEEIQEKPKEEPVVLPEQERVEEETIDQIPSKEEVPVAAPPVEKISEEPEGISTVDIDEPSGNWLFKRIWWEKAEAKYEKIKNAVDQVLEARMLFFSKRTELDRTLFDPFYRTIGLGSGELNEIISYLINELEKERGHEGSLRGQERELLNALQTEKKVLEQLQLDVQSINKLDNAIDDALTTLLGQINQARVYEKQAWQQFKAIAKELSDKKARELYYSMDTLWKNIKDINDYIKNAFSQHFDKLVQAAQEQINKARDTIQLLREKGIDFKLQAQRLASLDKQESSNHEDEEEKEVAVQPGFLMKIWQRITGGLLALWNSLFGGRG